MEGFVSLWSYLSPRPRQLRQRQWLLRLPHLICLSIPEAEFLDVIGTKVLRVFLLAIHSHLF
jgi:hypothetical protein